MMRKLFSLILALVLALGLASVHAEEVPTPGEGEADWNLPENIEMTQEVTDLFTHAMEGLVGVNYEPLGYLGEKDGVYCILCRATVVYPGAKPYYALVYVTDTGVRNIWEIWMDMHATK